MEQKIASIQHRRVVHMAGEASAVVSGRRPLINIFACADRKYQDFSILFALSNLYHVRDSVVEIGLEDPEGFALDNKQALSLLEHAFGEGRIILRGARFRIGRRRVRPGVVRFIETPSNCEYVYISDIDIVTLDPALVDLHVAFMKRRNLPYSNSARAKDRSRLSGLHFAQYDAWYPVPSVEDLLQMDLSDERLLRIICERKGFPVQQEEWFRPIHGIHMSPNRLPLGDTKNGATVPGWGIEEHMPAYRQFASSSIMQEMRPLFSERIRCYLGTIERVCAALTEQARAEVSAGLGLRYRRKSLES